MIILRGDASETNNYLEIATSNEAVEPICLTQYSGPTSNPWQTKVRTAALLDAEGDTSFPGTLHVGTICAYEKIQIKPVITTITGETPRTLITYKFPGSIVRKNITFKFKYELVVEETEVIVEETYTANPDSESNNTISNLGITSDGTASYTYNTDGNGKYVMEFNLSDKLLQAYPVSYINTRDLTVTSNLTVNGELDVDNLIKLGRSELFASTTDDYLICAVNGVDWWSCNNQFNSDDNRKLMQIYEDVSANNNLRVGGIIHLNPTMDSTAGATISYNKENNRVDLSINESGTRISFNNERTKVYGKLEVQLDAIVGGALNVGTIHANKSFQANPATTTTTTGETTRNIVTYKFPYSIEGKATTFKFIFGEGENATEKTYNITPTLGGNSVKLEPESDPNMTYTYNTNNEGKYIMTFNLSDMLSQAQPVNVIFKKLTVDGTLTCNNALEVMYEGAAPSTSVFTINGALNMIDTSHDDLRLKLEWDKDVGLYANVMGETISSQVIAFGSQTITHKTNISGEVGTFCESIGEIYNGYKKITNTDCICQVKQSKELNKRIVGIIISETQFASHGDVLVKVSLGEFEVGDILCPDENGYGKKATDEELMFMMLHAIPRPKITSLNTGIEGYVACFLG